MSRWENTMRNTSARDGRLKWCKEKCRGMWSQLMPTLCQSVKSGTVNDFLICISAASSHRATRRFKPVNTTIPVEATGIRLFKKGLAVKDISHQKGPGPCKSAGGKTMSFELCPNRFYSLVKTAPAVCSQSYLDEKLKNWSTFLLSPGGNSSLKPRHL